MLIKPRGICNSILHTFYFGLQLCSNHPSFQVFRLKISDIPWFKVAARMCFIYRISIASRFNVVKIREQMEFLRKNNFVFSTNGLPIVQEPLRKDPWCLSIRKVYIYRLPAASFLL